MLPLGMGDCALRDGEGRTRQWYLVLSAYSLLMHKLSATMLVDGLIVRCTPLAKPVSNLHSASGNFFP